MRTLLSILLFLALAPALISVRADEPDLAALPKAQEPVLAPTSAPELLALCRERLPRDPVKLVGWVQYRRPRGVVDKQFNYRAELRWGDPVPSVRYDITGGDGADILSATFRHVDGKTEMALESGPEHTPVEEPAWNTSILGTGVTWLYLSMDFLYWENALLAGEAEFKGRLCDLVEVLPPTPLPGCRKVRLWVDRDTAMFLQVQEINDEGNVQRQLWVRSVKKMDDRWMVQDMEVETRGDAKHRTRLHVLDCQ